MNTGTKGTQDNQKHPYFSFVVWMDPLCGDRINLLQALIPTAFIIIGNAWLEQTIGRHMKNWLTSYYTQ
jgi:hypothetical protein